jgi:hypothetical protein
MSLRDILALPSLVDLVVCCGFLRLEHFLSLVHPQLKRLNVEFKKTNIERSLQELDGNRIESLRHAYRKVCEEDELEVALDRKPCRLEYLICYFRHTHTDFLDWLGSVVDLSDLRTFDFPVYVQSMQKTMIMMRNIGSSLEHLTLYIDEFVSGLPISHCSAFSY